MNEGGQGGQQGGENEAGPEPPPPPPGPPPAGGYGPAPGQPTYGYYYRPPDHPETTTVLVLGLLGVLLCQVVAPFAWSKGNQVLAEIRASQGTVGGEATVNAGRICGIVGTIMLIVTAVFVVFWLALVGILISLD